MIRPINRDQKFLQQRATRATPADTSIVTDLLDTLQANRERCVGMAANMIGENKQIIACVAGPLCFALLNPKIVKKARPYKTKEGCLSLDGKRETIRYETITVTCGRGLPLRHSRNEIRNRNWWSWGKPACRNRLPAPRSHPSNWPRWPGRNAWPRQGRWR